MEKGGGEQTPRLPPLRAAVNRYLTSWVKLLGGSSVKDDIIIGLRIVLSFFMVMYSKSGIWSYAPR